MSRGFGGSARIVWQDENTVVYEYAPFNLNEPEYRNSEHVYDDGLQSVRIAWWSRRSMKN